MLQLEGKILNIFAHTGIGEGHIPEFNMGRMFLFLLRGKNGQILFRFQNGSHTSCAGLTLGIHDEDSGNAQHGIEDHGKILQKSHDDTRFTFTGVDPKRTNDHHQRQTQIQRQGCGGVGNRCDRAGFLINRS